MKTTGTVYLLHFDQPLGTTGSNSAQHYLGWTPDLENRLDSHRRGRGTHQGGARITQVLHERGIGFQVARTWEGADRTFERRLKKNGHARNLCPVCQARAAATRDEAQS